MPTHATRAPGLDTLRSLAIVAVVAYHLWAFHGSTLPDALVPAVRTGWMGVDLFFVLSGYLIASQLFRPYLDGRQPSLLRFYRNRLLRIQGWPRLSAPTAGCVTAFPARRSAPRLPTRFI